MRLSSEVAQQTCRQTLDLGRRGSHQPGHVLTVAQGVPMLIGCRSGLASSMEVTNALAARLIKALQGDDFTVNHVAGLRSLERVGPSVGAGRRAYGSVLQPAQRLLRTVQRRLRASVERDHPHPAAIEQRVASAPIPAPRRRLSADRIVAQIPHARQHVPSARRVGDEARADGLAFVRFETHSLAVSIDILHTRVILDRG